jgi:hypothetical protein
VSDRIATFLFASAGLLRPAVRQAAQLGKRARARLPQADIANALIRLADGIEAGFHLLRRGIRTIAPCRNLGLTGAFAWRGAAAMTGIGLSAALVSGLSASGGETTLASLAAVEPAPGTRPLRETRREPNLLTDGTDGWVRVVRPIAMFGLQSPELDAEPTSYEARRSQDGSRREEVLAFGAFDEARPHLLLRLQLDHRTTDLSQPFMIALVRGAASRALAVQRSSASTAIATRFGPVETADAMLSDGKASRPCIAFRMSPGDLPLAMSGWWCGADRPADRQQLVCLIDRLDLLSAGDDPALRAAFARTELGRRPGCAPPRLSVSGRKASWLDADGRTPALKTAARR